GHGRPCYTNDRGGTAATDYTQGRLKMQPAGHTQFYTTLTDATSITSRSLLQNPVEQRIEITRTH
ncbi:MAG: hypothetical protein ACOY7L_21510, partial [Pseudomonadota bacterium]